MSQVITLFEHCQKRELQRVKFNAKIAGAEIKDQPETDDSLLFKDPKDYEDMDWQERRDLTEKMKAHFMQQFGGGKLSG